MKALFSGILLLAAFSHAPAHEDTSGMAEMVETANLAALLSMGTEGGTALCADNEFAVYLGVRMQGFWLQQAELAPDGEEIARLDFSREQAHALAGNGLDRMSCITRRSETQDVTIRFSGRYFDASERSRDHSGTVRIEVDPRTEARAVVLTIELPWWPLARPRFASPEWWSPTEGKASDGANDPRLGRIYYLHALGEGAHALASLYRLKLSGSWGENRPEGVDHLLLSLYLEHSLTLHAHRLHGDLQRTSAVAAEDVDLTLRLAEQLYRLDRFAAAHDLLKTIDEPPRTPAQELHYVDLQLKTLLALDRPDAAISHIAQRERTWDFSPYMRFNLGLAFLLSGDEETGLAIIERIALMQTVGDIESALRDRANLLLGQHFLRAGHGATAKHYLQRIRLHGPYANQALLWWGRSELAPAGKPVRRLLLGPELHDHPHSYLMMSANLRKAEGIFPYPDEMDQRNPVTYRYFFQAKLEDEVSTSVTDAIRAWSALAERDADDLSVIEGHLELAHHLALMGKQERAQVVLEQVLDLLHSTGQAQAKALRRLSADDAGTRLKHAAQSGELVALPGAKWMENLLASHRFHDAFMAYAAMLALPDSGGAPVAHELRDDGLAAARKQALTVHEEYLLSMAREAIETARKQSRRYEASARFALARLLDYQRTASHQ